MRVLPEAFTSPCVSPALSPTLRPSGRRTVLCQSAHQPYQPVSRGASAAVEEDVTQTVSTRHPFSVNDSGKDNVTILPAGNWASSLRTVLPTPSFRAATLPD